jgi:transcriptional regulator with XRE-family HTH domain
VGIRQLWTKFPELQDGTLHCNELGGRAPPESAQLILSPWVELDFHVRLYSTGGISLVAELYRMRYSFHACTVHYPPRASAGGNHMATYRPFSDFLAESLEDPEIRAEWDRTQLAHDVSVWVLRYRKERGLTQTALARELGWPQSVIARLEAGDREPSIATLHRLAERLGTTVTILIRPQGVEVRFAKPQRSRRTSAATHSVVAAEASSSSRRRRKPSGRASKSRQSPATILV